MMNSAFVGRCEGTMQHEEIHMWLKTVYGAETVPSFEVNETTLSILQSVITTIEQQRKHSKIIAENLKRKALEYNAEGERIHEILQQNCILLPKNVQSNVSSLAAAGCVLSLKNASLANFLLSIKKMLQENVVVMSSRKEESRIADRLSAQTIIMQQQMQQLIRELKEAEKWSAEQLPKINSNSKYASFLKIKIEKYHKDLNSLEERLNEMGVDPKIYHAELVKNSEVIKDLKKQLNSVQLKLQSYVCLPANEDLARMKIAEAEMELENLEKELSLKLENVIPGVHPLS